jgi:acyl-CoA synthetase (AMP-forming)/AMP-acid ligase II
MSLAAAEKARSTPGAIALADHQTVLDWSHLDVAINQGGNRLLQEGIASGARVAVFAHNSVETALVYLICLHTGHSSVPANFHLTADELAYILVDSGAQMLFVDAQTAAVGIAAARAAGIGRVVGWGGASSVEGVEDWADWLRSGELTELPAHVAPAPHLHYTSGTTGRPKGALTPPSMFPRTPDLAQFFAALRKVVEAGPQGGPALLVGPLYHTGPLGSLRRLAGGKPLIIMPRFDAEQALLLIERWKIDSAVMVPAHFQRLLALPEATRGRYDVSSLRQVTHTGSACRIDVKRAMIAWWGPVLVEAYGGTESGTTNLITSAEWLLKPGSVGRPVAPLQALVIGEDGAELGTGSTGVLYFKDPTGRGIVYHNDPEKTAQAHREPGVFTLGDVGHVDSEGYVFITDRVSDMIVSGGVNIYSAEVEQALIQHPQLEDVAVIGVPNQEMGEEVKALVVAKAGAAIDAAELLRFCRERIAGYKCPRSFEVVADVGRNLMGKVNKRELRRPYWPTDRTIGG